MSGPSKQRFNTRTYPAALVAGTADRNNGLAHTASQQLFTVPGACNWRYQPQSGLHRFASVMTQGLNGPRVPPLARMAMAGHIDSFDDRSQQPDAEFSSRPGDSRRRNNEWYQERCVTCYSCHAPVTANPEKRGKQCTGCRKWFHRNCLPGSTAPNGATADPAAAGSAVATTAEGQAAEEAAAAEAEAARTPFYHTDECQKVHQSLQTIAAEGPVKLRARKAAPQDTWRLLDLTTIKGAYRTAQRLSGGMVTKQRAGGSAGHVRNGGGGATRPLDDFIDVVELLNVAAEEPVGEVLEDSFGVLLKRGDKPAAAATFNLYGRDHARLQSLVTAGDARRRGHARALVQQLQDRLREAGVKQLVVLIEPDVADAPAARRLFYSQGYAPASAEQRMAWRMMLPEYHRNLVNGCDLLVKNLPLPTKRGWGFF